MDLLEESRRLISIRSLEGTRELVQYLLPFCRRLGFEISLQPPVNGDAFRELNLIAHTVPRGSVDLCPDGLFLGTHLDTVPPGDHDLWTETGGDPYRATICGEKIYGLGSADTKLDFLCKLAALEAVGLKNIKIPLALVGTFGEERALAGIRLIQESGIMHPKFALVGEPSELEPVIAHKGILYLRAICSEPALVGGSVEKKSFHGKAAHGSMPHLGENAIRKAADWLFAESERDPTLQLLKIAGGAVHNIVPDRCEIEFIREGRSPCPRIAYLKSFFDLLKACEAYLQAYKNENFNPPVTTANIGVILSHDQGFDIEFDFRLIPETDGNQLFEVLRKLPGVEVIRSNPPMNTGLRSEITRRVGEALSAVGLPSVVRYKSGNTEGTILNSMGAESIVIGPGKSAGNIHAPNEYNEISQLKKAVEFYTAFLRQFV